MHTLSDYDYHLPEELIALYPLAHRSDSRLLVLHSTTGALEDTQFTNVAEYLRRGDCLVINETKVIPARLFATRETTGAQIEIFLEHRQADTTDTWLVLAAPAKKLKQGERYIINDTLSCVVLDERADGQRVVRFESIENVEDALEAAGTMPIPPYLHRDAEALDNERYQTVYAHTPGAVAAPTAGLHFTNELLASLEEHGIKIARITLHVGLGTFRPVETEDITQHTMHSERYVVSNEAAEIINSTKTAGGRVIAVGTTAARTLETAAITHNIVQASSGTTSIFIYPPYRFKILDGLITNFHQPRSTLLMMISAFAGYENIRKAYDHAIAERYRFLSYGDAMLIL